MSKDSGGARGPGRPRSPVIDRQITKAAARIFRERGWLDATMEEIAERAGVSKTTLYRRYPSKASVAFDAWVVDRAVRFPGTETGSVWGDLLAYILGSFQMANTGGWLEILQGLLAEKPRNSMVADALEGVWAWRRGVIHDILERAATRGEIATNTSASHVNELVDGPILLRLLVTGDPMNVEFADRLVDDVMGVIGPGH